MKLIKSAIAILSTMLCAHTIHIWSATTSSIGSLSEEKERQAQYEVKAAATQQADQVAQTTSSSSTSSGYTLPRCISEPLARVGNSSSLFNVGGQRMPAELSKYEITKWLDQQDLVEQCAIINQAMRREGRKDEWLLPTGQIIRLPYMQGMFNGTFNDIVASSDGKLLAITHEDEDDEVGAAHEVVSVTILDAKSGETKQTLTAAAFGDHVHDMVFSHENTFLIARACRSGVAYVWNVNTGSLVNTLRATAGNIQSCAFSPDGKLILTGSDNGSSQLWKTDSEEPLMLQIAEEQIEKEIFSPDGSFVVTKSQENWIHLWDVKALLSGETNRIQRFPHWGEIASVFNKDGSQFLTQLDDGTITVWDTKTMKSVVRLPPPTKEESSTTIDQNAVYSGANFADYSLGISTAGVVPADTSSSSSSSASHVETIASELPEIADAAEFEMAADADAAGSYPVSYHAINSLFSENGTRIIAEYYDHVCIWSTQTGQLIAKIDAGPINGSINFTQQKNLLAISYNNGVIDILNITNGALVQTIKSQAVLLAFNGADEATGLPTERSENALLNHYITFSDDASLLISKSHANSSMYNITQYRAHLWDPYSGEELFSTENQLAPMVFIPNSLNFVTSPDGRQGYIWNVEKLAQLTPYQMFVAADNIDRAKKAKSGKDEAL